jgi:hypothetical protein
VPFPLLLITVVLATAGCHTDQPAEKSRVEATPADATRGVTPAAGPRFAKGTLPLPPALPNVPLSDRSSSGLPCERPVVETDTTLATGATGAVRQPVRVRLLRCADRGGSYAFSTSRQEERGTESWMFLPAVLLADLDFDGDADLWATGCSAEGQCRARISDVWLYRAEVGRYVYSPTFSSLEELAVVPAARQLETMVSNCGCAAACHWTEVYDVVGGEPMLAARYERLDCKTYREWERDGDSLRVVCQAPAGSDETACPNREGKERVYLDWERNSIHR